MNVANIYEGCIISRQGNKDRCPVDLKKNLNKNPRKRITKFYDLNEISELR